jgi:hypothetical protein
MTQTIVFTGNSVKYGTEIDNERVTFSEILLEDSILNVSDQVSLSGGNLRISIPDGIDWNIEVNDSVGKVVRV